MQPTDLMLTALYPYCQSIHYARFNALSDVVSVAAQAKAMTLTALGRALGVMLREKYAIKRVDRLIGNTYLSQERILLYGAVAKWLPGLDQSPMILVDWSTLTDDEAYHLLRASVPLGGRSMTLYEEVHPQKEYGSPQVHEAFLNQLKALLPEQSRPILVTDAGFKNPWFRAVEALDWDWVGRVRGTVQLSREGEQWQTCRSISLIASEYSNGRALCMGRFMLAKTNPMPVQLYGYQQKSKGRVSRTVKGRRRSDSSYAVGGREAWLLASNLQGDEALAHRVVGIYKQRMQIEESFRDTKSMAYGLGLSESRSRGTERLAILVMISGLVQFIAWLLGKITKMRGQDRLLQANTIRKRSVLSLIYIGLRVLRKGVTITPLSGEELRSLRADMEIAMVFA